MTPKDRLLPIIAKLNESGLFKETFLISAMQGDRIDELLVCTHISPFVYLIYVCFVLFCFVLFCFVLFCFVLFCFVLFCFTYLLH